MKSKKECEYIKVLFYDLLDKYNNGNRSKEVWDRMFLILRDIAISLCKKKANGIKIPDLEEKALNATIYSMDLIKRGKGPDGNRNALYAWLNNQVIAELYDARLQKIEREISLDVFPLEAQEKMLQDSENGYIINIQEKRTNEEMF